MAHTMMTLRPRRIAEGRPLRARPDGCVTAARSNSRIVKREVIRADRVGLTTSLTCTSRVRGSRPTRPRRRQARRPTCQMCADMDYRTAPKPPAIRLRARRGQQPGDAARSTAPPGISTTDLNVCLIARMRARCTTPSRASASRTRPTPRWSLTWIIARRRSRRPSLPISQRPGRAGGDDVTRTFP